MCPDDAETRFSLLGRPRGGLLGPLDGVGRNMGVRIGLSTFPHGFGHHVCGARLRDGVKRCLD